MIVRHIVEMPLIIDDFTRNDATSTALLVLQFLVLLLLLLK